MGAELRWYQGATRGHWLALAAALLGWMFDGFEMGIFPLVARPALIDVLDLSADARLASGQEGSPEERDAAQKRVDAAVGLWNGRIIAAFLVGAAVGGWLFGGLGDRIGRVRAMALSVLTYACFTGLCGLAQNRYQLTALRFVAALGMGGEWALGVALVMECWTARARPMLAGLIGAASNVGFFLTAPLVIGLEALDVRVAEGGWRWVLGICAFPALLTFFLRLFVPESEKWQHAVQSGPRPGLVSIFAPGLRSRTLIGAGLSGVALIGTWGSVQWIPAWVNKMTGGSQAMANYSQMCGGVGAVLATLLAALVGGALGRRITYFFLCVGSLVVCAFLFRWPWHLTATAVDWRFLGVVFLTGGLTASFYGWLPLYLPELFPTRIRATGQGFAFNAGRFIAAAGALSTGLLMQDIFAGSYALAGATMSLIYLVGMLLVWLAPETHGQPLPE
jgi:SHS family sialic acid transporter-like MFS transporter